MKAMTVGQIASVTGADLHLAPNAQPGDLVGPDVCRDSREVTSGALFVAFAGERVDGHDYIAQARTSGAAAVLAQRVADPAVTTLVVADPTAALGRLARAIIDDTPDLAVVGVTGSSGKTSTKDLIAHLLEQLGKTVSPEGSQNNELGVPLTATRVEPDTRFLISEMGARGVGHVQYLCDITPPRIGVVLNVGTAHLGEFGSQADIARAKGELVAAIEPGGWAVLNQNDPLVAQMATRRAPGVRLAWCAVGDRPDVAGVTADLRVWADHVRDLPGGAQQFVLHVENAGHHEQHDVQFPLVGRHQVANAMSAAAVAVLAGMPPQAVAQHLATARPRSAWRMEIHTRPDDVLVINDAYNANPDSMRAALDATAGLVRQRRGTQVWAVVGDMLELGDETISAHEEVGRHIVRLGFHHVVAVGHTAEATCRGAAQAGKFDEVYAIADPATVSDWLVPRIKSGDTVLIKASRGLGLERVASALLGSDRSSSVDDGGAG